MWLTGTYLIHTMAELCLSPVGLSSMTKLAPARVVGLMMGVWFLGASVGNFIGGPAGRLLRGDAAQPSCSAPSACLPILAGVLLAGAVVTRLHSGMMQRCS